MKIPRPYKVVTSQDDLGTTLYIVRSANGRQAWPKMFGSTSLPSAEFMRIALNAAFAKGWKERGKRGSR